MVVPLESNGRCAKMSKLVWRIGGLRISVLALALAAPGLAWAQAQTNPADTVLQQNEQRARELEQATNPPPETNPILSAPITPAALPPAGGPTVALTAVVFEPASEFLSQAELDAITAPYVGKTLDFAAIAKLVQAVNDLYAEKGVVTAGAVLPPQTLADGVLKVQLVEGRQGVVSIVGGTRTRDSYLFDRIGLTRGDNIVDVPSAADDIAFFNKTNRAQVRLLLQPGAAFGFTDLTLGISEPPPNSVQFFADTYGVRSTGIIQGGVSYRAYGLAGMDDTLMLSLSGSAGSLAGSGSYDIPISPAGTRLSLGYSASVIRVVDGPTKPLDITGASQVGSLTLSQPVFANTEWSLLALASGSYGTSISRAGTVSLVESGTTKASIGFALGYTGEVASISLQPQMVYAASEDRLNDTTRYLSVGTINASGSLRLADDVSFVARGAGQYAGDNTLLPGDLLFEIGGPNSVRGYSSEGVAGDSGYYVQSELHWSASDSVDLYALADVGEVFSTFPARTTMASVGAGITYTMPKLTLDLTFAAPISKAVSDQPAYAVYAKLTGTLF